MTTLLKLQEDIAAHGNGYMTDHAVIIPQLRFSFQVQVMLHHFEEHLNVPPLAVNPYNFFVRQIYPGGQDRKPLAFLVAVTDKNNFYFLAFFRFRHHAGEDLRTTWPFPQKTVQFAQFHPLEALAGILYNSLRKIDAFNGQREDNIKQGERRHAAQLSDPIAMQQGNVLAIPHKEGNPVLQLFCFLLIPLLFGNVHLMPFLFDFIELFSNFEISESERLFTLICCYFNILTYFFCSLSPTQKIELIIIHTSAETIAENQKKKKQREEETVAMPLNKEKRKKTLIILRMASS